MNATTRDIDSGTDETTQAPTQVCEGRAIGSACRCPDCQRAADPLLGFSPDEIIVGPSNQTISQAATEEQAEPVRQALAILRRPQHPQYGEQARALLAEVTPQASLDELWQAFSAADHVPEVWAIAALAWHLSEIEPAPGYEERAVDRAKREGVLP